MVLPLLEHIASTCFYHFVPDPNADTAIPNPVLDHIALPDMTRAATLHSHTATHTIRATEHAAAMHEKALKALHGTADWDLLELIKRATFLHALSRHLVLQTAHNPDLSPSAVVVENLAARAEASVRAAAYRWHMPFSDTPPYLPILKAPPRSATAALSVALEDDNDSDDVIGGGADQQPIGSEYESEELTDDSEEEEEEDITWIEWFCNAKGNEYFIQVDEDYIRDSFNLTDLRDVVPYYDIALNTILDLEERSYIGRLNDSRSSVIENSTKLLYGLIQARFLITNRGLEALHDKFTAFTYGMCPNVDCESARQAVLPIGCDQPKVSTVKLYCPRCNEIYYPTPQQSKLASLDGAFFGSSAAHMFMMMYPHFQSSTTARPYEPTVYGFKVHYSVRDMIRQLYKERQQQREHQQQEGEEGRRVAGLTRLFNVHFRILHLEFSAGLINESLELVLLKMSSSIFSSLNTRLQEKAKQLRESYVAEDLQQFVSQLSDDTKDYTQQIAKKIEELRGSASTSSSSALECPQPDAVDVLSANEKYSCLPHDTKQRLRNLTRCESTYTEDDEGPYEVADEEESKRVIDEWKSDQTVQEMHQKLVIEGDTADDNFWRRFATKLRHGLDSTSYPSDQQQRGGTESDIEEHHHEQSIPTPQLRTNSPEGRLAGDSYEEDDDDDDI
ncbi:casein kinase 2 regulatory subunit, partial [Perkinsus olseni]